MADRRVMIQAGHRTPRQPGFEAGTGAAGEVEYVSAVADALASELAHDGRFSVVKVPGWIRPDGWAGDLFLSLHCDGSGNPAASGFCYGYPPAENGPMTRRMVAIHAAEYSALPGHPPRGRDNYTSDLAGYYGFHHVRTPIKVLFEHGFVSNPRERAWLVANRSKIVVAHYRAICRVFSLAPKAGAPGGATVPPPSTGPGYYVVLLRGMLPNRTVVSFVKLGDGRFDRWKAGVQLVDLLDAAGGSLTVRKVYRSAAPVIGKRL